MHLFASVLLAAVGLGGCGSSDSPLEKDGEGVAVLSLKIDLAGHQPRHDYAPTRIGEEYEPDKEAANEREKINTVRIIIVDSSGILEHNSLWDLTASPDIAVTGQEFPVKANDTKDIILVANEANAVITLGDGNVVNASDYFRSLNPAVGQYVDVSDFSDITYTAADNQADAKYADCLAGPLPMSAMHKYHIGANDTRYSATFLIHRAAVKYTYRITNKDDRSHTVDDIRINNVASRQYFFPDAVFTDDKQYFFSSYATPSGAGAREVTLVTSKKISPRETVELGPFYFPEGMSVTERDVYGTGLTFDGFFSGWSALKWSMPETPGNLNVMTDMPRNTHVVVNVTFTFAHFGIDYTVCPWNAYDEVDIPSFN